MYSGDWLFRLSQLARDVKRESPLRVGGNVWGLGITSLLTDISSEMVVSILPAYLVLAGGFSPFALGIATGLHEGGPMLATWIGGLIADRSGRRKVTAGVGYGVSALCRLGWFALSSPRVGAVATLVGVDRLGKAMRTAPRDALISTSVPSNRLATAFGVHRAMDAAGAAAGPMLAFLILWSLPRRYDVIFFTSLVAAALGVAALGFLVQESPDRQGIASAARPPWPAMVAAFADPAMRPVLLLAAAFGVVTIGDAFLYLLLVQRSHVGPQWVPLLYTGTAISFLVLAVPVGFLADRFGRRRVFVAGHTLLLLAYAAAAANLGPWPWNAILCVGLLGAFYAASDGVLVGLASGLLSTTARALGLAWVATVGSAARLGGAIAFGAIWTRAGDRAAVLAFSAGLIVVLVVALATGTGAQAEATS